jgi:hypothetical protein
VLLLIVKRNLKNPIIARDRRKDINLPEADKYVVNHYIGINIIFFLRLMDGKSKGKYQAEAFSAEDC